MHWFDTAKFPGMQKQLCKPWYEGSLATEYQRKYDKKKAVHAAGDGKGYIEHRNKTVVSSVLFDATSSNRLEFQKQTPQYNRAAGPGSKMFNKRVFDAQSTYSQAYVPKVRTARMQGKGLQCR